MCEGCLWTIRSSGVRFASLMVVVSSIWVVGCFGLFSCVFLWSFVFGDLFLSLLRGGGGGGLRYIGEVSLWEAFCQSQCWEDVSGLLDWQG